MLALALALGACQQAERSGDEGRGMAPTLVPDGSDPPGTGSSPQGGADPMGTDATGGVGASSGGAGQGGALDAGADGGGDALPTVDAGDGQDAADGGAGPDAGGSDGGVEPADLCNAGLDDGSPATPLTLSGDTFAHDPTMIEAGGVFYRFWTGDFIPMASSGDLMRWQNGPSVYGNRYPAWSSQWLAGVPNETFNFPWAPDVSFFGGRYHIYASFSAKFGDNISCITHLTTDDIAAGPWTDHGPVICTEGNEPYNAIDADVGLDADGKPWLAFGSFWDGIMAIELDAHGDRVGDSMTRLAWAREIEAPVLFRRCGYHYLFVTWGLCCPGAGRSVGQLTYRVAVGRSENILGPYVDRSGKPLLEGGGTLVVQGDGSRFAAAGHSDVIVTGDQIYHLYHGYRLPSGSAELRITPLRFDAEGWPISHPP